jgi:hypothetical protein
MLKVFGRKESLEKSNELVMLDLQIKMEEILSHKHEFLFGIYFGNYICVCPLVGKGGDTYSACCVACKELTSISKSKSHYDRRSVGRFVLVPCPFWSK